ncbi:ARM repeat-containing protein [Artomyces pyxidatus]|uniref:ARM repeat-containing protein n=1 Tax=Artomyces pyxidatus TaxID=48021 RepID=A0ACB8SXU1_9AGAM|nr:ARM repeat-containing protein [Artomyces pyxidatus]
MTVCTYKPIDLPSLEDIGVVPTDKVPHRASYVPINPMQASMNVWRSHSPLEGQVKALLRQLSTTKFDSVSVRLITLANRSEEEVTGQTLMLVIRLVVGSAIDKAEPQLHTRLCHAIMEGIHMDVRNKKILDREGKPWSGEKLVRMYLFNACQEAFKTLRIVFTNGASMTYLGGAGHERMEAAQTKTTKRRTHALIRFIVELFVSRIVYNQLVFACMDNLLGVGPADWVDEEDIELLSEVFVRTGSLLGSCANMTDFHKRKTAGMLKHRFIRIEMLASSQDASSRIRQILQSIIELRDRGWVV